MNLLGSIWRRREPVGDDAYDRVRVAGIFQLQRGEFELSVVPLDGFGPTVSTTLDSLAAAYTTTEDGAAHLRALRQRLDALAGGAVEAAWETPDHEIEAVA